MKDTMKNAIQNTTCRSIGILALLVAAIGLITLPGCNTWQGVGEDVEATGEAMQGDDE
jgi:predicted small secreted protein